MVIPVIDLVVFSKSIVVIQTDLLYWHCIAPETTSRTIFPNSISSMGTWWVIEILWCKVSSRKWFEMRENRQSITDLKRRWTFGLRFISLKSPKTVAEASSLSCCHSKPAFSERELLEWATSYPDLFWEFMDRRKVSSLRQAKSSNGIVDQTTPCSGCSIESEGTTAWSAHLFRTVFSKR